METEDILLQRLALDQAAIVGVTDVKGRIIYANDKFCGISGYSCDELIGSDHRILNSGYHRRSMFKEMYRTIANGRIWRGELCNKAKDGTLYWVDTIIVPRLNARMKPISYLSVRFDITARKTAEADLAANRRLIETVIANVGEGVCMLNPDGTVAFSNRHFAEMHEITDCALKDGQQIEGLLAGVIADLSVGEDTSIVRELDDGRAIAITNHRTPDGSVVITHRDVTQQHRHAVQIAHMARHDEVTGLSNRFHLHERISECLPSTEEHKATALHLIDLDHFKSINDTLGHPFGDKVLKAVAERLLSIAGERDTVARIGGDEFAVLQSETLGEDEAVRFGQRVLAAIAGCEVVVDGASLTIGASIGIALAPRDGRSLEQIFQSADLALYSAKGAGRGTLAIYRPEMQARVQARQSLERDLKEALQKRQLVAHYQPILDCKSGRIASAEALVRWQHPERGLVQAGEFIPLAEETGLVCEIGEEVLIQACHDAMQWRSDVRVAVNLSAVQFRQNRVLACVEKALAASGLPATRLELEITESVLLEASDQTLQTLHALRGNGVSISLDDFGTGFSSLSYLQLFPFDKIKIDRSFVRHLGEGSPRAVAIVRAVTHLANELSMMVVAEGVETAHQFDSIVRSGCNEAQGHLFGRPQPHSVFLARLGGWHEQWHKNRASGVAGHGRTLALPPDGEATHRV